MQRVSNIPKRDSIRTYLEGVGLLGNAPP